MIKGETIVLKTVDRFCKVCNTITEQLEDDKLFMCLSCYTNPDAEYKEKENDKN